MIVEKDLVLQNVLLPLKVNQKKTLLLFTLKRAVV